MHEGQEADIAILAELERKVLWLATWMILNANHLRLNTDGLKVGGHQASCASIARAAAVPQNPSLAPGFPLASL